MVNNFREQIIRDILLESGEIMLDEAIVKSKSGKDIEVIGKRRVNSTRAGRKSTVAAGPFSHNFFRWEKGHENEIEADNYGIPDLSKSTINLSGSKVGKDKNTKYVPTPTTKEKGKFVAFRDTSTNIVYVGIIDRVPRSSNPNDDRMTATYSRELMQFGEFINDIYPDDNENKFIDVEIREIGTPKISNKFVNYLGKRRMTVKEYEKKLMEYMSDERFDELFDNKLKSALKEKKNHEELIKKIRDMMKPKKNIKTITDSFDMSLQSGSPQQLRLQKQREEDMEDYEREENYVYDGEEGLEKNAIENKTKEVVEKDKKLKSFEENIRKIVSSVLKHIRIEWSKMTFEGNDTYMKNGLMDMCVLRYGDRSPFWPESFWNEK